jgi:RNA polymerase sigma-70 factor (ECF subfamily)
METVSPGAAPGDEAALLAGLRAGDAAAYDRAVRLYGGRMLAVARRFLPNDADAQDAVQDAFLSAFRGLPGFDGRSGLATWLHRIAVNACLLKLRTARRRPERPLDDLLPRFAEDGHHARRPVSDWGRPAEELAQRRETREAVRAAIARLPDEYRAVLLLRDIEGADTDEAARRLGTTPGAVKTRLHRARLALRTLLDRHFHGESA